MDGEIATVESVTKLLFILTPIHFDTVQLAVQVSNLEITSSSVSQRYAVKQINASVTSGRQPERWSVSSGDLYVNRRLYVTTVCNFAVCD